MVTIDLSHVEKLQEAELPTAHFAKLRGDMVWIRYKPFDEEVTLADAKKHTQVISEITGGQPIHTIIDFRGIDVRFSNAARDYFANDDRHSALRLSQALIIDSLAHQIVANFYLKFNKPNCPARIFSKPEDAVAWVKSLK